MSVTKGYALSDILSQVCKYARRIGLPPAASAHLLVALADVEYRLAFSTSEKLQLGSLVAAFAGARAALLAHQEAGGE